MSIITSGIVIARIIDFTTTVLYMDDSQPIQKKQSRLKNRIIKTNCFTDKNFRNIQSFFIASQIIKKIVVKAQIYLSK